MKRKQFLPLALSVLTLLGCSLFNSLAPSPSGSGEEASNQEFSTEGWMLSDPTAGLASLESYHQQLTIGFRGTRDGAAYEWSNTYQRDVWTKQAASFTFLVMDETGLERDERLFGAVGPSRYLRRGSGETCQVSWSETASKEDGSLNPAGLLPAVEQAADAGTETVNGLPARHYVIDAERSKGTVAGEYWLAEPGGYLVRYLLTVSGKEGEQRYEYELSQVDARQDVVYPEGCAPVLLDFPVMDGARNLHRLPESVDYTVPAETAAVSQFYQEQLEAQGWTLAKVHDKDPKNAVLVFVSKEQKLATTIVLSAREKGVWVSAIVRPWEPTSSEEP